MSNVVFLHVPCPSLESARTLARTLIERKLIASANMIPIESINRWEGELKEGKETVLILKTTQAQQTHLVETITSLHPYEIPCIAQIPVTVNEQFADWINKELK